MIGGILPVLGMLFSFINSLFNKLGFVTISSGSLAGSKRHIVDILAGTVAGMKIPRKFIQI